MILQGMPIKENPFLTETVLIKMCRSKRKRIVKKWLKNKKNYKTVPSKQIYIFGNLSLGGKMIVCHPVMAERIKAAQRERSAFEHGMIFTEEIFSVQVFQDRYNNQNRYRDFT